MRGKKNPTKPKPTNQPKQLSPPPNKTKPQKKKPNQQNKNPPQTRNTEGMKVMEILLQSYLIISILCDAVQSSTKPGLL